MHGSGIDLDRKWQKCPFATWWRMLNAELACRNEPEAPCGEAVILYLSLVDNDVSDRLVNRIINARKPR